MCEEDTVGSTETHGGQKILNSWTCQRGEAETGRVDGNYVMRGLCSLKSSVDVTFEEICAFS